MRLEKKRWIILIISCLINLCIGSLYTWSVFAGPLALHISEKNGLIGSGTLTAANLAIVFTVANSVGPITMISGGFFNDKLGPRGVVFLGGILFGGGMLASGFASNLSFIVVSYGLGCGLGMGLVYGCTVNNSVKFFPDKRGLIGGITTASYGFSSVILPPIANSLINSVGVLSAFRILGIIILGIICIGAFFIEKCPENYVPDGWEPKKSMVSSNKDYKWNEMIKDYQFYIMLLMLLCGAFSGLMIVSQASVMSQEIVGMSTATAAVCVSVIALFNALGRVGAGYLSDILGRINVLAGACILSIVGMLLLCTCEVGQHTKFLIAVISVGLSFGTYMGVYPGFTADRFGSKNNSMNYGIMFIGFALAGMLSPMIAGKITILTGGYKMAFIAAAIISGAGLLLNGLLRVSLIQTESECIER